MRRSRQRMLCAGHAEVTPDALRYRQRSSAQGRNSVHSVRPQDRRRIRSGYAQSETLLRFHLLRGCGRKSGRSARSARTSHQCMETEFMKAHCDFCRGRLGLIAHRYWHMRILFVGLRARLRATARWDQGQNTRARRQRRQRRRKHRRPGWIGRGQPRCWNLTAHPNHPADRSTK